MHHITCALPPSPTIGQSKLRSLIKKKLKICNTFPPTLPRLWPSWQVRLQISFAQWYSRSGHEKRYSAIFGLENAGRLLCAFVPILLSSYCSLVREEHGGT